MLHPSKAGVIRALARHARPAGVFDARRYFRGEHDLQFFNVGTATVRAMAKDIRRRTADRWALADATRLAEQLIVDTHLESKQVAVELIALYRREFTPACLRRWKRWLSRGFSNNWATTDSICGSLIGRVLLDHPSLAGDVASWAGDRNMWVRRASAVSLVGLARRGIALDAAYGVARRLHRDDEDLIQKAVGWMLREAGKADPRRLERYLRTNVRAMPRTTFRYAIERFSARDRRRLLAL
jgi:3-methyladenine DNA glycosylase AlkD